MTRTTLAAALFAAIAAGSARADAPATRTADTFDLRLTLSTFLYEQSGNDPAPLVDQGAAPQNASPVHRLFTDLRLELTDGPLAADGRIRQTTSERYQAGASSGGEYELRTLAYRIGSPETNLVVGRQFIDAVASTKIDGLAFHHALVPAVTATVFAGAFPQLGSRSLDTDYVHVRNADGSDGALILPVAAGLGTTYQTTDYHGDVGVAGVYVPTDVPGATSDEKTRVYATASGYFRPAPAFDIYHFALVDLVAAGGANLVDGNLGADVRPLPDLQLSLAAHHVSTDILQIVARNYLADPDPTATGVVQNNIALLRIAQDTARAGASLALAQQRFELSASAGVHRRPAVSVALPDGSGAVVFPEVESSELTFGVLDRRSLGGLRAGLSATLTEPIGSHVPNRSRGTTARAYASRMFAEQRGELQLDLAFQRLQDVGTPTSCASSLAALSCFGTATTTGGEAGVLGSWRVAREWLVILDTHLAFQQFRSTFVADGPTNQPVRWPDLLSITTFARIQWRYR